MIYEPLIGITCNYEPKTDPLKAAGVRQNHNYAECVANAGGLPVMIPLEGNPEALADRIDGLLIPGGNDINPANYGLALSDGELKDKSVTLIEDKRFEFECQLYTSMKRIGKPIFGICYGVQFINVLEGGSLYINIPTDVPETLLHQWQGTAETSLHQINTTPNSRLAKITLDEEFFGVSSHHQAIQNLGQNLFVSANAPDGIIEAIEGDGNSFLIGIQWHPERQPNSPITLRLFEAFINASRRS